MKYTLRFLIVTLCILCSTMAFADRRGADLFKPASNYSSPSQWTNARSGNSFSYSRDNGYYSGDGYAVGSTSGIYRSSTNSSIYKGDIGERQFVSNGFLGSGEGSEGGEQGQSGTTTVRGGGTVMADPYRKDPNGPVGDAIPFVLALAMAFAAFKFYRNRSRATE